MRSLFPEFEGKELDVSFHRSWSSICTYVTKKDPDVYVWGDQREKIVEIVDSRRQRKRTNPTLAKEHVAHSSEEKKDWIDFFDDPIVTQENLTYYMSMRSTFDDLWVKKAKNRDWMKSLRDYLSDHDHPDEYDIEVLKEKYFLLDWLATNLICLRPIKTKQLFLYGTPNTQKTFFFFPCIDDLLCVFAKE